ncbi:TonB family protein [Gilvimarinus sp. SDUM040013]|uniref:TonB family protein n=1 Tax=Gilvimarinus gilvus TaxID=3058038 RepID=A0ABU4RSU1_9GAMM|nr:TonB family protein [Gilvimarinus sp. SDUM040013]MDO3388415.1 TonB family protein [Gilvimarinus sp. SDUM040013]MDX6847965.1 TonB family protein [Gilvimarinus sp. SDUM040013]
MQKTKKHPTWLAYLVPLIAGLLIATKLHAEPLLNGVAVHQELGKDRFIGAIYSENLTESADLLLASNIPMRLEMKITADRGMSARRFSRMWIEGMAINIRSDALAEQADNMVAFTKIFQDRLLENDHIVMSLTPGDGVAISVNGVELGQIDNDAFFGLLASTWVGRVPLSSNFRDQLLQAGDVSTSLQARYEAITPSDERNQQVAAWIAPPPRPEPEPEPEPPVVATLAATEPAIAPPKLDLPPSTPEPEPSSAPVASVTSSSEASSSVAASSSSEASQSSVSDIADTSAMDESDEDFVPTFTAESLLANQRYFSNLVRKVQLEIKYPRRSLRRGDQGFVRIAVMVDRGGNLLNAEMLEESEHSLLNKEAMSAVEDAAPFAAIPNVISGRRHEFTIPITFALSEG